MILKDLHCCVCHFIVDWAAMVLGNVRYIHDIIPSICNLSILQFDKVSVHICYEGLSQVYIIWLSNNTALGNMNTIGSHKVILNTVLNKTVDLWEMSTTE